MVTNTITYKATKHMHIYSHSKAMVCKIGRCFYPKKSTIVDPLKLDHPLIIITIKAQWEDCKLQIKREEE